MTSLEGDTGQVLEAAVVATFLPSEVVDSLYAVMVEAGLEVASLTLEPIAALNAAIPEDILIVHCLAGVSGGDCPLLHRAERSGDSRLCDPQ